MILEARQETKMTKSRALNFALNSLPIVKILVVIRGQHIGFRLSNHLKQGTWRVLLFAVSVDIQFWEFGPFWRVFVTSQNIICTDPRVTSRLGNIQWRLIDFARTFNCSFPNLLCLPFAFVDIFVDTFFFFLSESRSRRNSRPSLSRALDWETFKGVSRWGNIQTRLLDWETFRGDFSIGKLSTVTSRLGNIQGRFLDWEAFEGDFSIAWIAMKWGRARVLWCNKTKNKNCNEMAPIACIVMKWDNALPRNETNCVVCSTNHAFVCWPITHVCCLLVEHTCLLFEHAHVCWPGAHVRWLSTNVLADRAHMCVGRATVAGRTHMPETQANEFQWIKYYPMNPDESMQINEFWWNQEKFWILMKQRQVKHLWRNKEKPLIRMK